MGDMDAAAHSMSNGRQDESFAGRMLMRCECDEAVRWRLTGDCGANMQRPPAMASGLIGVSYLVLCLDPNNVAATGLLYGISNTGLVESLNRGSCSRLHAITCQL